MSRSMPTSWPGVAVAGEVVGQVDGAVAGLRRVDALSTVQGGVDGAVLGTLRRPVAGGGGPVGGLGPQAQGDAVDRSGVARRDALEWSGPRHRHSTSPNASPSGTATTRPTVLRIVTPLDAKDTDKAMQRWANYTNAHLDDDPQSRRATTSSSIPRPAAATSPKAPSAR